MLLNRLVLNSTSVAVERAKPVLEPAPVIFHSVSVATLRGSPLVSSTAPSQTAALQAAADLQPIKFGPPTGTRVHSGKRWMQVDVTTGDFFRGTQT